MVKFGVSSQAGRTEKRGSRVELRVEDEADGLYVELKSVQLLVHSIECKGPIVLTRRANVSPSRA